MTATTVLAAMAGHPARIADLPEWSGQPWPRYEICDGTLLVSPSPAGAGHFHAVNEIQSLLQDWAGRERVGQMIDIARHGRLDRYFTPDLVVLTVPFPGNPVSPDIVELVVEVLSPSTAVTDQTIKRQVYKEMGITWYWIIDPEAGTIEFIGQPPGLHEIIVYIQGHEKEMEMPWHERHHSVDDLCRRAKEIVSKLP